MLLHVLRLGLKGIVTAAMLAAAMQTCSAALNSASTLFAYDIWKRWKPDTSDHSLVVIGKWTTVVATLIAIVLSPIFGHYETIFQGLNKLICYLSPPITAVFLVGVFWKRAGARAAYITMISGIVMGLVCFVFDFFKSSIVGADATPATIAASPFLNLVYNFMLADWMLTSFVACALCVGIHIVCSFVIPEPLNE
jgi:SSS family solute:Na+ symporter